MPVGLGSSVLSSFAARADRAPDEDLADASGSASMRRKGDGIRPYADFDAGYYERRARTGAGLETRRAYVERVNGSLKGLYHLYRADSVIADERGTGEIVAALLKRHDGSRDDAVHVRWRLQACRNATPGVLILDDDWFALARILSLAQNPHLA